MQEMQVPSQGWEYLLEKEMETHTSILAGKFHGQRNLAGYSPWGCKRVRHNLVTKQQQGLGEELLFYREWISATLLGDVKLRSV